MYHSKQLGEEKAVIEQVQFGAIDFTRVSISPLAAFAPAFDALQMPYLYRGEEHMWKVLNGPIGEEFLNSLEPANFVGLAWYDSGARNFYKRSQSVADLKGLRSGSRRASHDGPRLGPRRFPHAPSASPQRQTGVIEEPELRPTISPRAITVAKYYPRRPGFPKS